MASLPERFRTWGPAGALMALVAASTLFIEDSPRDPRVIAAVFPPWWDSAAVFKAADASGDVLGFGSLPCILILHARSPGLGARARAHGALLTLDRTRQGLCIS